MRVIDPADVEPTVNPASEEHREGRQVHRRILSLMTGGPASIDLGYNRTAEGIDFAVPYAYDRDEFCYTAAGSTRMQNDGETWDFVAGQFMWRPVGAATQRFTVTSAYNSICAFGPARVDGWSHILPESYHKADDGAAARPRVQFLNALDVAPRANSGAGVTYRQIFDTPVMEVAHISLDRGARADLSEAGRDQVYFLERGSFAAVTDQQDIAVRQGQFFIVAAADHFGALVAEQDCVLIRWSAPGRD